MRVLIVGLPRQPLPALMGDFTEAVVVVDNPDYEKVAEVFDSCEASGVSVRLVAQSIDDVPEELLDRAAEIDGVPEVYRYAESLLEDGDLALIAWDDSDSHYHLLRSLQRRGVVALDMNDNYAELEIGQTPDIDHLVEVITARVLKAVRAELKDMTPRRLRSAGKKA